MPGDDSSKTYPAFVAQLLAEVGGDAALEAAVGGDFLTAGKIEFSLLRQLGLSEGHSVVDIGCGSGRLAFQLKSIADLSYLGTDVVPELLGYAGKITQRPGWTFALTDGTTIPCAGDSADFVCFFSVFTHLRHEDTYRYLEEARRVLKPGGRIVFSFLEFYIFSHWAAFQRLLISGKSDKYVTQFMDRHAIRLFAHHLNLKVDLVADGDRPHIPIHDKLVSWPNGGLSPEMAKLGQSVAVLSKPL
jgi:SAM-dependent methyltransferase